MKIEIQGIKSEIVRCFARLETGSGYNSPKIEEKAGTLAVSYVNYEKNRKVAIQFQSHYSGYGYTVYVEQLISERGKILYVVPLKDFDMHKIKTSSESIYEQYGQIIEGEHWFED